MPHAAAWAPIMLIINSPEVIAQVTPLHDAYERALVSNDSAAVKTFFWDSPHVVRFGINDQIYGGEALAEYLRTNVQVFSERRMIRRNVLALGRDAASVTSEYEQNVSGQLRKAEAAGGRCASESH